eukprot:TRINITY_DN6561_c1_g1_i3.p5 TRINITY_DN6561_c1_g1~~TRINITY_DN6561_c1_g1_i3.p5  ORF type:complete len:116 (+),score=2.20 TRINITY_DN6561_c1_g1_i3:336-683(+)
MLEFLQILRMLQNAIKFDFGWIVYLNLQLFLYKQNTFLENSLKNFEFCGVTFFFGGVGNLWCLIILLENCLKNSLNQLFFYEFQHKQKNKKNCQEYLYKHKIFCQGDCQKQQFLG